MQTFGKCIDGSTVLESVYCTALGTFRGSFALYLGTISSIL